MELFEFLTADDAEKAFYTAFEQADIKQMMSIWANDAFISCVHPMSVIQQGFNSVANSWRQIFSNNEKIHFQISYEQRDTNDNIAVHVVTESIYLQNNSSPRPPILATNIYKRTDQGWKMILHHASPSIIDPAHNTQLPDYNRYLH